MGLTGRGPQVAHLPDIVVSPDGVRLGAKTCLLGNKTQRHQTYLPIHAHHARAVVTDGTDDAGHVGRVRFSRDGAGVIDKVIAVHIAANS